MLKRRTYIECNGVETHGSEHGSDSPKERFKRTEYVERLLRGRRGRVGLVGSKQEVTGSCRGMEGKLVDRLHEPLRGKGFESLGSPHGALHTFALYRAHITLTGIYP